MTTPTMQRHEMNAEKATRSTTGLHETELIVPARQPFTWQRSLDFVSHFPATRGEQVIEDGELIKAWRMAGRTVVTRIGAVEEGLRVRVASEQPIDAVIRETVADRVTFYLSLDDDLGPLERGARHDPGFAGVEQKLHGYHQVKFPTPVEHVVWAILSQRTPMAVARSAKQELIALNPALHAFGHDMHPFPSLSELARRSEEDLLARVKNTRKASYLHRTLQRLTEVEESFLRTGPYDEVEQYLLSLPGIGPWSANFVLIRGLGRMERIPSGEELQKSVDSVYGRPHSVDEIAALAQRYAPAEAYWAHYLRAGS